jgi:hypothetical protein
MRGRWFGWLALAFWIAWLAALQGALVQRWPLTGGWPNLPLLLLLSFAGAAPRGRARVAALLTAGIQAQFSGAPLPALAAALLLAVEASGGLRRLLSQHSRWASGLATFLIALGVEWLLHLAFERRIRLPMAPARSSFDGALLSALATGLCAALLAGGPRLLPGLPLLWRTTGGAPWVAVARAR